jgi:outer membrane immunogenic protein
MRTYKLLKLVLVTTTLSSAMLVSAATVSDAADAPRPPVYRVPPPPPYYLWSGFYAGAHVGAGWVSDGGGGGFVGGGQVGYNYQVNNWVFGLEGDFSGTSIGNSVNVNAGLGVTGAASGGIDWISTLTPRVGYAFDRWLVYAKAGAGWAHGSGSATVSFAGVPVGGVSVDSTSSAFVFGVGTEYAFRDNWTAKVEYNVFDFSSDTGGTLQVIKAGVNYRFGGF